MIGNDQTQEPAANGVIGDLIAGDNDGAGADIGDPPLDNLPVDQAVIHSCQNDRHGQLPVRYSVATLICSRP